MTDDGGAGLAGSDHGHAPVAESSIRLRLDLAYQGTEFSGWASQPGLRTVQAEVESAMATVLGLGLGAAESAPALTVAGRTDAGVHARGQVAHFDVPANAIAERPLDGVLRRVNGVLAPDVRLKDLSVAPAGFDARFSALSRRYAYRVADGWADPLRRHDTLFFPRTLDLDAMNAAAEKLLGVHDFASFCKRRVGATTVRTLLALDWSRDGAGVAIARVEADAFCHSMVRSLIGVLLEVGGGRHEPGWPAAVLAGRDRAAASAVVSPHGLTLEEVTYPDADELASRAAQTRQRRAAE